MNSAVSKEEFAQLVQQHGAAVIDFTTRLLPDRREAEEAAQDAFVKAFQQLQAFRGESSLLTWVLRIAYREAIDRLRRRRPHTIAIDEVRVLSEFRSQTPEADELSTGREERILLLEEAVATLPAADQLLLHLFYYDDRPLREIAYIMDAEPNTLSQRLHRIRKRLLTLIKQKENEQNRR